MSEEVASKALEQFPFAASGYRKGAAVLHHQCARISAQQSLDELHIHQMGIVYTEEAHLPSAPFLIHYHFAI